MTSPGLLLASIAGVGLALGGIIALARRRQRRRTASAAAARDRTLLTPRNRS
ncbi:MAG: hypothetical protein IT338_18390 [Thermomicrobiales bacterium]|nr:hypothetical protein [Thermomicrobiales bacterium]